MLAPKLRKVERMKPKAKAEPTAEEQRHHDKLRSMSCVACGAWEVSIHHAMKVPAGYTKIRRRDHRYVVPICPDCHQGDEGIHGLGSEAAFKLKTGVDIPALAVQLWEERYGA